jgi:hypothetical protein
MVFPQFGQPYKEGVVGLTYFRQLGCEIYLAYEDEYYSPLFIGLLNYQQFGQLNALLTHGHVEFRA